MSRRASGAAAAWLCSTQFRVPRGQLTYCAGAAQRYRDALHHASRPMSDDLANPIASSLSTRHRECALSHGNAMRYPAAVAPFLGVSESESDASAALAALVAPEESVYLLGVAPRLSAAWSLKAYAPLAQMVCEAPIALIDGPPMIELDESHRADVLALTALVYPHYFRPRTMDLGRYFGIYVDGRLAAISGERLGTHDTRELSAICTHPDFLGRGYARRLTAMLTNDTLARGALPFLHVSHENARAKALYEQLGFRLRRDIGFWSLRRS
jgi:ribosomal protein S18 acetylase RimI-like enzyme